MRLRLLTGLLLVTTCCFILPGCGSGNQKPAVIDKEEGHVEYPNEFFFSQRTYPDAKFAYRAYEKGLQQSLANRIFFSTARGGSSNAWQLEGPGNIGGRVNVVAVHPTDHNVTYVGCSQGGIFKTTDGGNSWIPIFDDQPFPAIGDIKIDPQHPDTVYVGTGDPNISGYPFIGDGVYKSRDGGQTWVNMGLTDARIISKIIVHPANTNMILAACMGLPFERNSNRGLYKSSNGGVTWNKILFLSDSTGVIDVLVHPTDTNIIYAAGWDRIRNNQESRISGLGAKIYKTIDGGNNWIPLTNGLPTDTLSRIGLEMDATNPNILYAEIVDTSYELRGIYKSVNGGTSWTSIPILGLEDILGGFGWYFGKIRVNPFNTSEIYVLGIDLWRTTDNGNSWLMVTPEWWTYDVHADKHDLVFLDASTFLLSTDGGVYRTDDGGANWADIENIPNTQLYHVGVNPHDPNVYWGGAQDNGITRGNAASMNFWERVYGGDGFRIQFNQSSPDIFYAETQNGGITVSTDGGFNFSDAIDGIDISDRRNWDMPYIVSTHQQDVLYAGTFRMYKSNNGAVPYWNPISSDLTNPAIYDPQLHTISTIDESPANANILYAGTSDGNVWRTLDGGTNWQNISAGLPQRYVTDVKASWFNDSIVFVAHSGYRDNDFIPHLHVSFNHGDNWLDISGNLPQLAVNDIEVYAGNDSILFAATDGGVYYTTDMGGSWTMLGTNLPIVPVFDIEIDAFNKRLVAGTFARSIYTIAIDSLLTPFHITADAGTDREICLGGSTQLSVSGGLNYAWSPSRGLSCTQCANPSASPTATTTYTVTVHDAFGNSAIDAVVVSVKPQPVVPVITQLGDSLFTTAIENGYQWYLNNSALADDTLSYFLPYVSGSYRLAVTNTSGCTTFSSPLTVIISAVEGVSLSEISVYPNPSTGIIRLEPDHLFTTHDVQSTVYDIEGKKVFSLSEIPSEKILDLRGLQSGCYFLELKAGTETAVKKILLNAN